MDKTALQYSGLLWTIIDHIIGFVVTLIAVHLVSRYQKNKNYRLTQAILVAFYILIYSLLIETLLPMKYSLYTVISSFLLLLLLCKYICNLIWKKGIFMGLILFIVKVIVGIAEGMILSILKRTL